MENQIRNRAKLNFTRENKMLAQLFGLFLFRKLVGLILIVLLIIAFIAFLLFFF
ncbi:MAG: hypothetical protein Q7S21_03905 [archaeon]|nr:hypothetical protein [archaeon]